MNRKTSKAFTLIELLIVVLIIAILAAIAIPNFIEFQTRAKVSRVKSDLRTIGTGLEAYCVDEGTYPARMLYSAGPQTWNDHGLEGLTTPIAYLTTLPADPFGDFFITTSNSKSRQAYEFGSGKVGSHASNGGVYPNDCWLLESAGPDQREDSGSNDAYQTGGYPWVGTPPTDYYMSEALALLYDPTNGTVSEGQIVRVGGASPKNLPGKMFSELARR